MTKENPVFGKGPDHFPEISGRYYARINSRFLRGRKEAHTLWLNTAAESGIPGLFFLAGFYLFTMLGLQKLVQHDKPPQPGFNIYSVSRMVNVSLVGFIVSAQFVSLEGLEAPYYLTLVGLGALKIAAPGPNLADANIFATTPASLRASG